MKELKTRLGSMATVCLLLWALLAASCIKDDYAVGEQATVTMKFATKAQSNAPTGVTLANNEQMQTLRVIVARKSEEILFNTFYNIAPNETQKVITFSELTVNKQGEKFDFYAIANEAGFLGEGETLDGLTAQELPALYERVLTGGFEPTDLLPQAAYQEINVLPQKNNKATMQLQFPAAKVQLTFVNKTGEAVNLSDVKIAGVAPNQAYLFYQGNTPDGTTLTGNVDFGTVSVSSGTETAPQSTTQHRYLYPGSAGAGKYKLTANWNGNAKELPLAIDDEPISSLLRGVQLNITVTLKQSGGFGVKCEVQPWQVEENDYHLSDAGTFDITGPNAKPFPYDTDAGQRTQAIATQYGVEAGAADRYATFTIQMTAPEGVRWMAHLTNAQDFEFVVDESHAAEGVGGTEEVTVMVRPTKSYDATTGRKTTELYVTLGTDPNTKQKFVEPGNYCSVDGTTIPIVQVSPTEGDGLWSNTQP